MSTTDVAADTRTEGMNAVLAENWWAVALRGVLGILFGLIALFMPGVTMLSLVLVFAAYSLVDGVLGIIAAVRGALHRERWIYLLLNGILSIAVAVVAFLWPAITVLAFVLLVAAWALVTGVMMLVSAFRLKATHGRWWLLAGGVISIIYGVLLVIAPLIGAIVLTWWIGAHALVLGVMLLVLAFRLRAHRSDRPHGLVAQPS
jgi:uncharacterized membrane protein HdeD (DUF308 family)